MLQGETIASGASPQCPDCGTVLKPQVLCTNAYYIGTECRCGPYSRESDYFPSREAAEAALQSGQYGRS